ncbi:pyrimidine 5'-nucleotidase [Edhazardia aedis USNM 41457]|uniref:Pyrimidine 5'-nucleotidase n=1 Tax=Edhazardia aedis (strain USNM 41457) TaxID=1003232 RepID=J9DBU9_EDHAE|nr:pyrimidine 5'-nucleotidase [Edhazardia aedis USNM 41457]|eukprot:EJW05201.1 pyrimidine 5'-nucleotidase [Edhazardia aedis USNM 41457]
MPATIPLNYLILEELKKMDSSKEPIFVFDIDDTLYCQSNGMSVVIKQKIHEYAKLKNISDGEITNLCEHYSREYGLAIKGFCKHHEGVDPEEFNQLVDGSIDLEEYIKVDKDLSALLLQIPYKKFCFTNASIIHADKVLNALGIRDFFDAIFHCEYKSNGEFISKPDDESFLFIEKYCNQKPQNIFFFDDNERNIKAAVKRGWNAFLINKEKNIKLAIKESINIIQSSAFTMTEFVSKKSVGCGMTEEVGRNDKTV